MRTAFSIVIVTAAIVTFGNVTPKQRPATASPAPDDNSAALEPAKADNAALQAQVAELTESLRVAAEAATLAQLVVTTPGEVEPAPTPSPAAFVALPRPTRTLPPPSCASGVCRQPAQAPKQYTYQRRYLFNGPVARRVRGGR